MTSSTSRPLTRRSPEPCHRSRPAAGEHRIGWLARAFPRVYARGTIVTMASESLRTVRDRFSEFIERVQAHHERVVVTKNGSPAAVLISPEDLESLEETLAVLGDSDAVAELVEAHRSYLEGDVVRGVEAVKALRPR
jgi:antitoxin YefM